MFANILRLIGIGLALLTLWIWAGSSPDGLAQLFVDFFTSIYDFVSEIAKGLVNAIKDI